MEKNKIYFVSDVHLGVPNREESLKREKLLVKWLDEVSKDASEIFILGDLFDFWFEYKHVIPKGYSRLFGKLIELTDKGLPIHYFKGNHDLWAFDYLETELGLKLHRNPKVFDLQNKKVFIAHGDGLGPGDWKYKILKKVFENKFSQLLFRIFHPDWGIRLALSWSRSSRKQNIKKGKDNQFLKESERLFIYSKNILKDQEIDYFIFGHRHMPILLDIGENSKYLNLGDWINNFSYAVISEGKISLFKNYK